MFQNDYSLLKKMRIDSDAVVINQCDMNSVKKIKYKENSVLWVNTNERGLSRSRNMSIKYADSDICLLCDDDEILYEGYRDVVIDAYNQQKDADIMVFNIHRIGWNEKEKTFKKIKRVPKIKTYSSVHLSFKRSSIVDANICFNQNFGAGSGKYSCAEDALFCIDSHRKGLKMYAYPKTIASVKCEESSWFKGYNESFFYDTGAFLSEAYPHTKRIVKWYYPIRCKGITQLSGVEIIKNLNYGIDGYNNKLSYQDYINSCQNGLERI